MKSIRLLFLLLPLSALAQTKIDFNSQLANMPFTSVMSAPFSAKGDCVTDDTDALQAALDTHRFVYLPKPPGGCYLVSRTLVLQVGDYMYGASANNPNAADPNQGVVIRLAPNSNVSLLKTFDAEEPQGGGNEYMAVENIVFDGNGANQTQEMQGQALVDYRGTFIQTFLRHVIITNAFGPGLFHRFHAAR